MSNIISRKDAKAKGLIHYFTGKPCKNGHVGPRRVRNWTCRECDTERSVHWRFSDEGRDWWDKYYSKNRDHILHQNRMWRYHNSGTPLTIYSINVL